MDWDDSGEPPDLDETTLRGLPPPDAAHHIPDDRLEHLTTRDDDQEQTVRQRLEVYRKQTRPLIAHYRKEPVKYRKISRTGPTSSSAVCPSDE